MLVNQPPLIVKSKRNSKNGKQLLHNILVDMLRKVLNALPMPPDNVRVFSIRMLGSEFRYIIDLKVILHTRNQRANPRWLPPIIISLFQRSAVVLLLFVREGEDGLCEAKLRVDFLFAEAVVCNVEKPCILLDTARQSRDIKHTNVFDRFGELSG